MRTLSARHPSRTPHRPVTPAIPLPIMHGAATVRAQTTVVQVPRTVPASACVATAKTWAVTTVAVTNVHNHNPVPTIVAVATRGLRAAGQPVQPTVVRARKPVQSLAAEATVKPWPTASVPAVVQVPSLLSAKTVVALIPITTLHGAVGARVQTVVVAAHKPVAVPAYVATARQQPARTAAARAAAAKRAAAPRVVVINGLLAAGAVVQTAAVMARKRVRLPVAEATVPPLLTPSAWAVVQAPNRPRHKAAQTTAAAHTAGKPAVGAAVTQVAARVRKPVA